MTPENIDTVYIYDYSYCIKKIPIQTLKSIMQNRKDNFRLLNFKANNLLFTFHHFMAQLLWLKKNFAGGNQYFNFHVCFLKVFG